MGDIYRSFIFGVRSAWFCDAHIANMSLWKSILFVLTTSVTFAFCSFAFLVCVSFSFPPFCLSDTAACLCFSKALASAEFGERKRDQGRARQGRDAQEGHAFLSGKRSAA